MSSLRTSLLIDAMHKCYFWRPFSYCIGFIRNTDRASAEINKRLFPNGKGLIFHTCFQEVDCPWPTRHRNIINSTLGMSTFFVRHYGCSKAVDRIQISFAIFRFVDILKGRDQNLRCRSARMPSNCLSRDITSLPQPFDMNDVMEADERNSQYMNVFKTVNLLALQ